MFIILYIYILLTDHYKKIYKKLLMEQEACNWWLSFIEEVIYIYIYIYIQRKRDKKKKSKKK